MAFNAFVNFGDIKGESTDKDHKDWVTAIKVTFNVSQPTHPATLTVEKAVDRSSPKLIEAVAEGTHIPEVTIDYTSPTRASGGLKYLEIKLKEVIISSITHQADPFGGHRTPIEQVAMTYRAMRQTYTGHAADNKSTSSVAGAWTVASAAKA